MPTPCRSARWQRRFEPFSFTPIAAASIGQVHRAKTRDGRNLAIKIQYPGVRKSISSDVNNVASLLRMSGLLPKTLDIAPLLLEAKRQLREEADYQAEGAHLQHFAELLAGAPEFVVPELHADLTTKNVLAMSFVGDAPVESMTNAPQAERDRIVSLLAMASDRPAMRQAGLAIGYFDAHTQPKHQTAVPDMFEIALERFFPTHGHVYIVTDAQTPAWLRAHKQITVIDHRDLMPAQALPTFDSDHIESYIHRIPNLSERYFYCNDDVFFGAPVKLDDWF